MRVEPDLPDHPKFIRLKRLVGEYAMEALIRLWGHCQKNQRGGVWPGADSEYVEVVCAWDGEPGLLYRSLRDKGWLHEEDGGVVVHQWNDKNRQFLANWNLGNTPKNKGREANGKPSLLGISTGAHPTLGLGNVNESLDKPSLKRPGSDGLSDRLSDHTKLNCTVLNSEGGMGETVEKPSLKPSGSDCEAIASGLRYDLAREVLHFLNEKTGSSFPENAAALHTIAARLQEVSQDLPGVCQMISRQVACWSADTEMKNYLRPATLFHEQKFSDYYGQRKLPMPKASRGVRKDELLALIEKSPANKESVYHNPNASAEEKQKLREWREELRGKNG